MGSAEELKAEANRYFAAAKYWDAVKTYEKCLGASDIDQNLRQVVYRNLAQCFLNLGITKRAIEASCSGTQTNAIYFLALKILPTDTKALYRRSLAYEQSGNIKDAISDAQRLIRLDPQNKQVKELAFRLEACVLATKEQSHSLSGKIDSMFSILTDKSSNEEMVDKVSLVI